MKQAKQYQILATYPDGFIVSVYDQLNTFTKTVAEKKLKAVKKLKCYRECKLKIAPAEE